MTEKNKCIRCGSTQLASGWAQSTGKMYFRPDKVNFFALKTADLSVTGLMCLDCGFIELVGDTDKAKSLIKSREVTA
jgi:predicted nucleic-acid-binding Zn-ribbon protein